MRATDFLTRYGVTATVTAVDAPTPGSNPRQIPGRPWFDVAFTYTAPDGRPRTLVQQIGGGVADTAADIDPAETLYRLGYSAYYGRSYDDFVSDLGLQLLISREEWEAEQQATQNRCRDWARDEEMFTDLIHVEPDRTVYGPGHPAPTA